MHRQSSYNRVSAFNDSERSLRRCFSSIHHHSSHRTSPTSPLDNDDMNNHCNKHAKKKESLRRKSHHHHHGNSGPSRRISMDTTSGDEKQLSSLPYANNNNNNKAERHNRHSHPTTSKNKTKPHNRRASYAGITAQTAQEMVAEMLNDKNTRTSSSNAHHQHSSSTRGHTTATRQQQKQKQPPRRRVTVSFGPTKDQLQQLRNSTQTQYDQQLNHNNSMPDIRNNNHHSHPQQSSHNNPPQRQHMGYRPDYKLGQVARSPSHLLIPPSSTSTNTNTNNKSKLNYINQIATLLKHDFAFVKRSNGLYSYAILAYRTNPGRSSHGANPNGKSTTHNGGGYMVNNSDDYYDGEYKEEGMAFVMDDVGSTKMIRKKHWFEYIRLVSMDDLSYDESGGSDSGMEEAHPDVNLSYQQFKSRTATARRPSQDDPQENVPQDMLCQEIPQVCQEVNPQVNQDQEEMFEFDDDEPLPEMIVFDPTSGENEDCSLISSVSDRARRANRARVWR